MLTYEVPGYFPESRARVIKEKLQGKTYFNFNVEFGGIANNNSIFISSRCEDKERQKEFEETIIFFVFSELGIDR